MLPSFCLQGTVTASTLGQWYRVRCRKRSRLNTLRLLCLSSAWTLLPSTARDSRDSHQSAIVDFDAVLFSVKIRQSYHILSPDRALGLQGVEANRISRQSVYESGKISSPTNLLPLPLKRYTGTHFCLRLSRPKSHSAAQGIESATFWLVAQCLNHLRHRVPLSV
jgi:hypothetical protein